MKKAMEKYNDDELIVCLIERKKRNEYNFNVNHCLIK